MRLLRVRLKITSSPVNPPLTLFLGCLSQQEIINWLKLNWRSRWESKDRKRLYLFSKVQFSQTNKESSEKEKLRGWKKRRWLPNDRKSLPWKGKSSSNLQNSFDVIQCASLSGEVIILLQSMGVSDQAIFGLQFKVKKKPIKNRFHRTQVAMSDYFDR